MSLGNPLFEEEPGVDSTTDNTLTEGNSQTEPMKLALRSRDVLKN
jgi:hypothetical protein